MTCILQLQREMNTFEVEYVSALSYIVPLRPNLDQRLVPGLDGFISITDHGPRISDTHILCRHLRRTFF